MPVGEETKHYGFFTGQFIIVERIILLYLYSVVVINTSHLTFIPPDNKLKTLRLDYKTICVHGPLTAINYERYSDHN